MCLSSKLPVAPIVIPPQVCLLIWEAIGFFVPPHPTGQASSSGVYSLCRPAAPQDRYRRKGRVSTSNEESQRTKHLLPTMTDQQTDGPSVPYQPSSGGPHPTLAGNMFDPNVRADGAMSGSQGGVGGQDERTMHAEGLEHIKNKAGIGAGAASSSTTSSTTGASTTTGHPPSTNPSAEDPSGGIPAGAGGVSSSAHKMSPVEGVVGHENEGQKSVGRRRSRIRK
ncbi:hypothetical protein KC320_g244 [Hortaea werneckii]|nr:hypothetical protein KC320_g244 [Hortaea werneckii]